MAVDIPLYLFAKAPVEGRAKRRMCPPLTQGQAAKVAAALLLNAGRVVEQGWLGQCVLSAAPDLTHPAFEIYQNSAQWQTNIQPDTDLGGRMEQALQSGIENAGAAAVLGTDIPAITADILVQAHAALAQGRQVVGPSLDGGFYLLGLNRMPAQLFSDIQWGSADVYAQLLRNAAELNMILEPLPTLSDCDYYEDLEQATINGRPGLSLL